MSEENRRFYYEIEFFRTKTVRKVATTNGTVSETDVVIAGIERNDVKKISIRRNIRLVAVVYGLPGRGVNTTQRRRLGVVSIEKTENYEN